MHWVMMRAIASCRHSPPATPNAPPLRLPACPSSLPPLPQLEARLADELAVSKAEAVVLQAEKLHKAAEKQATAQAVSAGWWVARVGATHDTPPHMLHLGLDQLGHNVRVTSKHGLDQLGQTCALPASIA